MSWPNALWPVERTELLKKLIADGLSFRDIAVELNTTRSACIGKAARLGLAAADLPWKNNPDYVNQKTRQRLAAEERRRERAARKQQEALASPRCVRFLQEATSNPKSLPPRPIQKSVSLDPLNLTLDQLHPFHCRYITNDDMAHATYCGHSTHNGTAWCSFHHARIYVSRDQARADAKQFLVERRKWKQPSVLVDVLGEKTEGLGVQT